MKLYLWKNVLRDYFAGMMMAVAESPEAARAQIREVCKYVLEEDLAQVPEEVPLDKPYAFFVWGGG